jgi:hypothetical protein
MKWLKCLFGHKWKQKYDRYPLRHCTKCSLRQVYCDAGPFGGLWVTYEKGDK